MTSWTPTILTLFNPPVAGAAEISADKPYPQTSLYQRTVALIDVSDKDGYMVDIFRVKGEAEHRVYYSLTH